jgi:hypothetical protein
MTMPLAHLGHHLWILYLLPILIVIGGIAYSMITGRRPRPAERGAAHRKEGDGQDSASRPAERPRSPSDESDPPGG